MDTIINKISEIESAAAGIMEDANARKKAYAEEIEEKIASFDSQLEAETEQKIEELRSRMEVEMQTQLKTQRSKVDKILAMIEQNYNNHHEAYARQIYQAMIKE